MGVFSVCVRGEGCGKARDCERWMPGRFVRGIIVRAEGARLDVLTDL